MVVKSPEQREKVRVAGRVKSIATSNALRASKGLPPLTAEEVEARMNAPFRVYDTSLGVGGVSNELRQEFAVPPAEYWSRCWRAAIGAYRAGNREGVLVALRALYGPIPPEETLWATFENMVRGVR